MKYLSKKAKPFLKWAGGKTQLIEQIKNNLPEIIFKEKFTYIEPFVGSGAVLFWLLSEFPNMKKAVINDINKELIDTYYATYPNLRNYINKQIEFARQHGYVETILGRRRYLPDIHSHNQVVRGGAERNAVNAPIQGSAADIIKIAMIRIYNQLQAQKLQTRMLLQVHDELVFDVPKTELELVKPLVKEAMENAFTLAVPLVADLGVGDNWLDAH